MDNLAVSIIGTNCVLIYDKSEGTFMYRKENGECSKFSKSILGRITSKILDIKKPVYKKKTHRYEKTISEYTISFMDNNNRLILSIPFDKKEVCDNYINVLFSKDLNLFSSLSNVDCNQFVSSDLLNISSVGSDANPARVVKRRTAVK